MITVVIRNDVNLTRSCYRVLRRVNWTSGAVCSQNRSWLWNRSLIILFHDFWILFNMQDSCVILKATENKYFLAVPLDHQRWFYLKEGHFVSISGPQNGLDWKKPQKIMWSSSSEMSRDTLNYIRLLRASFNLASNVSRDHSPRLWTACSCVSLNIIVRNQIKNISSLYLIWIYPCRDMK